MPGFWFYTAALLLAAWVALWLAWRVAHRLDWIESADGWRGPPPRVGLALALATLAGAALLMMLLARAWRAAPLAIDLRAAELAREAWSPATSALMRAVTWLGDPLLLGLIGIVVGVVLLRARQPVLLGGWMAALLGNAWLNPTLKGVYARIRPEADLELAAFAGYSFPSGHTSGAMVCYGMLAYLCWRLAPPRLLLPVLWSVALVVIGVGASRVLLQAHFASDVLAGCASGAAWLALTIAGCAAVHRACHN